MNAVERLWRAVAGSQWADAATQLQPYAVIDRVGTGTRLAGRAEVVGSLRATADDDVALRRVVGDGKHVAVEVDVGARRVAGFYLLVDGRIAGGNEYWQ